MVLRTETDKRVAELKTMKQPISEKCMRQFIDDDGIARIIKCKKAETHGSCCTVYAFPEKMWKLGRCPMETHLERIVKKKFQRVGQQKQRRHYR